MEEFRSTEILDKEIQDDARRKADKLLKKAESDGKKIINDMRAKLEQVASEKEAFYAEKIAQYKSNADASLPLEKNRFLASHQDDALQNALNEFFKNLPEQKKCTLVVALLKKYAPLIADASFATKYFGMNEKLAKKCLAEVFTSKQCTSFEQGTSQNATSINLAQNFGLVLCTKDGAITCRATLAEYATFALDTNRAELSDALFAGRLSQ